MCRARMPKLKKIDIIKLSNKQELKSQITRIFFMYEDLFQRLFYNVKQLVLIRGKAMYTKTSKLLQL